MNVDHKIDLSQPQSLDARHLNAPACCFIALPTMDACKPNESCRPTVRDSKELLVLVVLEPLSFSYVSTNTHVCEVQMACYPLARFEKIKNNTLWTSSLTQSHLNKCTLKFSAYRAL